MIYELNSLLKIYNEQDTVFKRDHYAEDIVRWLDFHSSTKVPSNGRVKVVRCEVPEIRPDDWRVGNVIFYVIYSKSNNILTKNLTTKEFKNNLQECNYIVNKQIFDFSETSRSKFHSGSL